VASRGPVPARVLLLAGAPRHHEEREGVAFASPLFSWLEESLTTAGIDPAHVHYATLIGCRPPHQRPLRDAETAACASRLDLTVQAAEPRVIVLCGPDVVAALLPGVSLSNAHGTLARRGRRHYYPIRHPYTALHSDRYVAEVMDDLRRLAALLDEEWPAEPEEEQEPAVSGVGRGAWEVGSGTAPAMGDGRRAMGDGKQEAQQDDTRAEAVAIAVGGVGGAGGDAGGAGGAGDTGDTPDMVEDEDGPTQLSLF